MENLRDVVRNPFEENKDIGFKPNKPKKKLANLLKTYTEFIQSDIISSLLNKAIPIVPGASKYDDKLSIQLIESKELLRKASDKGSLDSKYILMRMNFVISIFYLHLVWRLWPSDKNI